MNDKEIKELKEKILEGLKLAHQQLILQKIKLGQRLIICEDGVIKEIDPIELKQKERT
jgi:hypothetical protein